MDYLCSIAEADAHYAREVGRERSERAWILSDRDVWYRNPFYTGPAVPHPEDDYGNDEDFPDTAPMTSPAETAEPAADAADLDPWSGDIPF